MRLFSYSAALVFGVVLAGCQATSAPDQAGAGAGAAAATAPDRLGLIEAAWRRRLDRDDAPIASMTVAKAGKILKAFTAGNAPERYAIASLSKAITGACIADAINSGLLTAETTLADVFGKDMTGLRGASGIYGEITIAQLLTHTSGLWPDQTQGAMPAWRRETKPRHVTVSARALSRATQQGTTGRFQYNNENYAILGAIIDAKTPGGYADYCGRKVLGQAYARKSARLSPVYGSFAAWGGWEMTTADYMAFFNSRFGPGSQIGADPKAWPHASVGDGAFYGIGVFFRPFQGSHNFWHVGRLCFNHGSGVATYSVIWKGEWAVTTGRARCARPRHMRRLDRDLSRAALQ